MQELKLAVPEIIAGHLVAEDIRPDPPARNNLITLLAAFAFEFQIHPAAQRRADIAVRVHGILASGALDLKELRMLQITADE